MSNFMTQDQKKIPSQEVDGSKTNNQGINTRAVRKQKISQSSLKCKFSPILKKEKGFKISNRLMI